MIPIVTVMEMNRIDAAAPEGVEVLIGRAATAVARSVARTLGGLYGHRVLVVAGKGNNGNDGRLAAAKLASRGARCRIIAPRESAPSRWWGEVSLVIDAAFGTGYQPREPWPLGAAPPAPVLAVDIPSGVSGDTGQAVDGVWPASHTITFAALKPGLVLSPGRELAGKIEVVDIGLDTSDATAHLVEAHDVGLWLPTRPVTGHKWHSAVWVVAGSAAMSGAAALAVSGAQRAGAGYLRLSTPGAASPAGAVEAVGYALAALGWSGEVLRGLGKISAMVIGPGMGRSAILGEEIRRVVAEAPLPIVVDADALFALADLPTATWPAPRILTPHDGEFATLAGGPPGPDRFAAARFLAAQRNAIVLLKGPTTIVATPEGAAFAVTEGPANLATAGTGDVLAGLIGGLLAQGLGPFEAATAAAFIHGRAGRLGRQVGLVASDLPDLFDEAWRSVLRRPELAVEP